MKNLILLLLIFSLYSCSPANRIRRILKNHPELIQRDTIFRNDTTVVNGVSHDTIFKTGITSDTIIIRDKQLTIKYFNDGKTTYIKGKCDTITIIKKVPFIVNKLQIIELTKWQKVKIWLVDNIAWIILILMFIFWLAGKFGKILLDKIMQKII